ncbi:hypothetical protein JD844_009613 [Phrynosoma platyrhinos]|uniref:Protein regulator of cytokinesis 1 n=1 Tax=Phrynosoma platyrhinos TaxID=52577 RepID=A0ABQ7TFC9_PHRPL|nr:hypothetical protein JD844_009613 [Phrynosoma platyrhinos]
MAKPQRESEVLASSLVNSVTQALGKLQDLWNEMGISRELQMERMQAAKSHIEVDPGLTILQLEKELRLALDSVLKEKHERLVVLQQLQQEDQLLCTELCSIPYYIPTGSVPSSLELKELKEHIEKLSKIKEQRLEDFFKLRREIRQYNKEIGHTPDGTLENEILTDEECICLTKKNLEDLQLLIHQLQVKKESLIASREVLMKEVQLLWDRLQWPEEKREGFTRTTSKCSISEAINMWEEELLSLEELKKEKLKEITLKVREELDSYWKKCCFGDEQRAAFQPFYDDSYSEELLNQHDEELVKVKDMYEKNKALYDSVHKWEATLYRFIELELGEELKKNIENWEKENDSCFVINNQRFLDTMSHQLQHYKLKKDHQSKISVKRDEFATPKTTFKRSADVNTPTPNKMRKVASSHTVLKAASCSNIATNTAVAGKQAAETKTPYKSVRLDSLNRPPLEECKESKSTNQPSYSDFMKELSMKSSSTGMIFNSTLKENLGE